MQFHLRTLLTATTLIAALCGIVFAAPLVVTFLALAFMVWVSPCAWIAGLVYARGRTQAFFLGGVIAGAVPCAACSYYSAMVVLEGMGEWFDGSGSMEDALLIRLSAALIWLAPGIFAFTGGALSYWTHRFVAPTPPRDSAATPRLASGHYRVVEGRLTAVAPGVSLATDAVSSLDQHSRI